MFNDFVLKVVIRGLLPSSILENFSEPSKYNYLINFTKQAIYSTTIYIKGPEIFLRIFLFLLIIILKFFQFITFQYVSVESVLKKISNIHPILDDGMRLYILLAMFAAYEDDTFRVVNGFLPIEDVSKPFKDLKYKN